MASSRKYLHQIRGSYPRRDPEDLICMISLLASVWAGTRGRPPSQGIHRDAPMALGALHHPARPSRLAGEVSHLAEALAGISRRRSIRERFRRSISVGLLATCRDPSEVLAHLARYGIGGLLRL